MGVTTLGGLWVTTLTLSSAQKNVLRDTLKTKLLTISLSRRNPIRNTVGRHKSTSYLWVAQVHRVHDKQLIFKLSHFAKVWTEVLVPSMIAQSTYNVNADMFTWSYFSLNNKDKKMFTCSVLVMV